MIFGHVSILGATLSDAPLDSAGVPEEFWFNLKTNRVEFGRQVAASYRVGPFRTELEAQKALETLADRSREWQEEED